MLGSIPLSAFPSVSTMSVPRLSALLSASSVSMPMPRLFALLLSALPSASSMSVPVPGSSGLLSSALPSASSISMLVLGSLATLSVLSISGVSVPVPRSSAPLSVFGVLVPVPGSFSLPFPTWSDPQTPTLIPGRRRLGQWIGILKRVFSKEAPSTFAPLFLPSERPSPLLFLSSGIGEKRLFNKAFNINYWPLADDYAGEDIDKRKFDKTFINAWPLADKHAKEEVDLSFAGCGCSPGVKLNKPWQIDLLERRPAYIVKTIPLAAAIF